MRNILAILALFVCTSICLGQQTIHITEPNSDRNVYGNGNEENKGHGPATKAPRDNIVNITEKASHIGHVYGAYMNNNTVDADGRPIFGPMTGNKVNVFDINTESEDFNFTTEQIYVACSNRKTAVEVNDNAVEIKTSVDFMLNNVFGGRAYKGIVSSNAVTISSSVGIREVLGYVCGGYIDQDGEAILNKIHLTYVYVENVYGGRIIKNGTATGNTVNLTNVIVSSDVYGAWIGRDGDASSNTVTIISGAVKNVYGGRTEKGIVSSNTVTISSSVKIEQNVYGAYIGKRRR